MKLLPLISILLLTGHSGVRGADGGESARKGEEALADQLWEIAEEHFKECLADRTMSPEMKSRIAIHLAEALVRAGNPKEALELLGQSFVSKNPETPFWKAQALAGEGRFAEAAEIFESLLAQPDSPHRNEAGLTRASLLLALDQPDAALETLSRLLAGSDNATTVRIRLYQVEILLDLGRTAEARQAMPTVDAVATHDKPLADLLVARLLLDEGQPAEAETRFHDLALQQGLSALNSHSAMVFLADAIHAQGNSEAASKSLLAVIQKHPDSPLLEAMFQRIIRWLPDKTAATDPIIERVSQWITVPAAKPVHWIGTLSPADGGAAVSAWPMPPETADSNLSIWALYTRAIALHRMGTAESKADARILFNRLRIENPNHFLVARTLYQQARWFLEDGAVDQALSLLGTLRDDGRFPQLKGEAAFLEARTAYQAGDPEKAVGLFDEAAKFLEGPEARQATLQAAIARLRSSDPNGIHLIQQQGKPADSSLEPDLAVERALATSPAAARRSSIEEFLLRFPDHPRVPDARLVAAEASLTGENPDLRYAAAQLETLESTPEKLVGISPARMAAAHLRILDLGQNPATTTAAQAIIDTFPGTPQADEAAFTLGRNLFQAGDYNKARLVLVKLAERSTDKVLAPASWLLAARCAALGATPQSEEEALLLFDKVSQTDGPLAPVATLEKARHLIDLHRFQDAARFLDQWTRKLPENDPLQLPAGLLLGEALFAESSTDPAALEKALAVCDNLLNHIKEQPALFNRLQYLRGIMLEKLPDKKDPSKTREKEAFQAYHSVLEGNSPPPEWEYFGRCGSNALALLEKAERWQAAIALARKIASFKGPNAAEVSARAAEIQLKHWIWED